MSESFAEAHVARVWEYLRHILKVPVDVGLHSVAATRPRVVGTGQRCQGQERGHPIVTDTMIDGLHTWVLTHRSGVC